MISQDYLKIIIFLIFGISINYSFCQNYQPFYPDNYAYFQDLSSPSSVDAYKLVVAIDETMAVPHGSFYTNYSPILHCQDGQLGIKALGNGLLQDTLHKHWVICQSSGDSIYLNNKSSVGDSWLMYENDSLRAYASHDSTIIFIIDGAQDSLKIYNIEWRDSLDQLISLQGIINFSISQNYGMVDYFDPDEFPFTPGRKLQGVARPDGELGAQWLDEWQIYQYEIGDEFHIRDHKWDIFVGTNDFTSKDVCTRTRVLERVDDPNGLMISYLLEETRIDERISGITPSSLDTTISVHTDTVSKVISYEMPGNFPYQINTDSFQYHYYSRPQPFGPNFGDALVRSEYPTQFNYNNGCFDDIAFDFDLTIAIEGIGESFFRGSPAPTFFAENWPYYVNNRFGEFGDPAFFEDKLSMLLASNSPNIQIQHQAYPNPTRDRFTLEFQVNSQEMIEIMVQDLGGRRVINLQKESPKAGKLTETLNLQDLPKGIYMYSLKIGEKISSGKLIKQ
ncbi:MAG: T9SS type A sorting domain-containing protein [Bacteroidia bacterium]|nr:T9SS type A sorting domain-containing protein [Bacteroidia bacterium]